MEARKLRPSKCELTLHSASSPGCTRLASHTVAKTSRQILFTNKISDLLPHISVRDNTSVVLAQMSNEIRATLDKLTEVEAESLRIGRRNIELTAEVFRLAEEAEKRRTGETDDPAVQTQMARLQAEFKASRQRWKVTKGTASAIVAGSGVDWARDPELRYMVLDPEEE